MYKKIFIFILLTIISLFVFTEILNNYQNKIPKKNNESVTNNMNHWVDSVFNSLTLEEKIAQLMFIPVYSNKDTNYYNGISNLIKKYNIGGITFFQGGPVMQAKLTNKWQKEAKTPLLVSMDAEWGLGMRLKDSAVSFPRQLTLGAIQNDSLIYEMGAEIAKHCKRLGVNMNFAPVLDINNNPLNPVINSRSFGENKYNVASKGIMYIKGLQDNNVLATAKHFPGHGDTKDDSHKTLPVINHNFSVIDTFDAFPFKKAIESGVQSIMLGHLFIPDLDNTPNLASSLSPKIIKDYLINKLNFKGLVLTDGLAMNAVANYYKPGDLEVKALTAGNDILLLPTNIPAAINSIAKTINNGTLSQSDINIKCKKILACKYQLGLNNKQIIEINNLYNDLNNIYAEVINRKLYKSAITLVKNNNNLIPVCKLDTLKLASVSLGVNQLTLFQNMMNNYAKIDHYILDTLCNKYEINKLIDKLKKYNLVIVGIHNTNQQANTNYGITNRQISFINNLKKHTKIILDLFANPYALSLFNDTSSIEAILMSYQDNKYTEDASAQIIFGGMPVNGKLPVSIDNLYKAGDGISINKTIRLGYVTPEELNINPNFSKKVDSLINSAIIDSVFPGCQVLYAYKGKVFYYKSYGKQTYNKNDKNVDIYDLYDIASLTKVLATTLEIMKLYENNKIYLDDSLGSYLDFLKNTNKSSITIRNIMTHQARLKAWIPFYKETIQNDSIFNKIYSKQKSETFSKQIAENMFIRDDYIDTIYKKIAESELLKKNKYLYSDLGFILLKLAVEKITNVKFDVYLDSIFYKPLGLHTMTFNPLNKFTVDKIIPTEDDKIFRKQIIHGYVHDQTAAMLEGVSGHAGLFSNANDIAIILQMLLQNGNYGNETFFKPSTVKEFTKYQFPKSDNRRALGFDKPIIDTTIRQTCKSASLNSYGHSGFTGTYMWADPDQQYIFVFLSNRTYPNTSNNKLLKTDIRNILHQFGYDAITYSNKIQKNINKFN